MANSSRGQATRWNVLGAGLALVVGLTLLSATGCETRSGEGAHEHVGNAADALTKTVSFQRGVLGTVSDTFVSSSEMKKTFGTESKLRISAKNEALIRFDLTSIPGNAVINGATLSLYLNGDNEDDDDGKDGDKHGFPVIPIYVHRATAPWVEATTTYRSFAQHFDPAVAGVILPTSSSALKSVDIRRLVQSWVSGAQPNDGVVLETAAKKHTLIVSSEGAKIALRPSLVLTYTTPDDHCASNPCTNGGTCTNSATSFTCACPAAYTGARCETLVDNCAANPCRNGGSCQSGVGQYTCSCPSGFSGANCETNIDECALNPCRNGGVCTDGIHSYTCACPAGFTGASCEVLVDNCASAPCQNGGACTNGAGSYACACPLGFTGGNCEINIDDCAAGPCRNGGTCSDGVGTFTCSCAPGFAGATCETIIDNCSAAPCQNAGTCTNAVDSYTCACAPGFTGANCEIDINECASNPCQNGGLCVDGVNAFTCRCTAAFTGATCETPQSTDPCLQNGGALTTRVGDYTINSQASISGLSCVGEVTGTLLIDGDGSTAVLDLPSLQKLGALRVTPTSQFATISLGALTAVSGFIDIERNASIVEVTAGSLTLAGGIVIANDAALQRLSFSNLASVTALLIIAENPRLTSLGPTSFASLRSAPSLDLSGSPLLTSVDMSNTVFRSGGLNVANMTGLTTLKLGPLPPSVSNLVVTNVPLLTDIGPTGFSGVTTVTNILRIGGTGLASFGPTGLSNLVDVTGGELNINENPNLTSLGPTSLASLRSAPGLGLSGSPLLTSVDMSNTVFRSAGLNVGNMAGLTTLKLGPLPSSVRNLVVTNVPLLTDIGPTGFSGVTTLTNILRIGGTGLASFGPTGLSNLVDVTGSELNINENPNLTSLGPTSFASLRSAPGLGLSGSPLITSVDMSNTVFHSTSFGIANMPALTSLKLGPLPPTVINIVVTDAPLLTDLGPTGFSGVTTVTNILRIGGTGLASFGPTGLSNLVTVTGSELSIAGNPNLTSLGPTSLASLTSAAGSVSINSNAQLTSIDASALESIGAQLNVSGNAVLRQLDVGALTHLGGNLVITNNPDLPTCFGGLLAQLVGFTGAVTIGGNGTSCL
jgi:hypothetical protein